MNGFDKRRLIVALCFGSGIWLGFASGCFVVCLIGIYWFVRYGFQNLIYSAIGWGLTYVLFVWGWRFYWRTETDEPKQPRGRPLGKPRQFDDR